MPPNPKHIWSEGVEIASTMSGFPRHTIVGRRRFMPLALWRQIIMAGMVKLGCGYSETARWARRDHGNVIHACKAVQQTAEQFPLWRERIAQFDTKLEQFLTTKC